MSILSVEAAVMIELLRGPCYGLALITNIEARTQGVIVISSGSTVYETLKELRRKHFIRLWKREKTSRTTGGGRPKEIYILTALGEKRAKEYEAALHAFLRQTEPLATDSTTPPPS